ncbi:MAG: hypothetical protein M3238_08735 [Actinomycetota bacterium]|nr:hypothetical protein [Actinomycetota bacterium]
MRRVVTDLKELRRGVVQLFENDAAQEEAASYALAESARRFSKNTKEVVDDKLSFSATLMRAGEVSAANRLLEEVETEVRTEEAALIETVNEVKVAQSLRRERITRLRLARLVAVAAVGATLLTFSAAGMAIAGFLRDRAEASRQLENRDAVRLAFGNPAAATGHIDRNELRGVRIGDVRVMLTESQFARLKEITGGGAIDQDGLQELLNLLPQPLADRLQEAIIVAQAEVEDVGTKVDAVEVNLAKVERRQRRQARAARQASEAEADEAQPDEEEQPTPDPTPSDNEDEESSSNQEEEGGDSKPKDEEGESGPPPLPINP